MIPAQTTLVPAREGLAGLALDGLTRAEVRERAAAGQVNTVPAAPGRSLGQILRANLCTRFNAILGTLFGVVLVVGPPQDALFGLVLAANTAIGVAQELRAKRTLDRLAVLTAARAWRFSLIRSELQQGTNQILRLVTWVMVPAGLHRHQLRTASHPTAAGDRARQLTPRPLIRPRCTGGRPR